MRGLLSYVSFLLSKKKGANFLFYQAARVEENV